jgi:L-arabinose isomerase
MNNNSEKEQNSPPQPRIVRRKQTVARIGVFGVGYYKYWNQFEGLLDALKAKQSVFLKKLEKHEVEVIDFGIVDNVKSAYDLVPVLKAANLDLIFCDMLTYATSSTFGTIIRSIDVPIVMVALQPDKATRLC